VGPRELRRLLTVDRKAQDWDLVDFIDMMLATGKRIGETAALTWDAIDLGAGIVEIRGTVVRIKGQGLIIKPKPPTRLGSASSGYQSWVIAMCIAGLP
jgi:integrase